MRLFRRYCEICGVDLGKDQDLVRFGKHFCSEEHASKYADEVEQRRRTAPVEGHGDCCYVEEVTDLAKDPVCGMEVSERSAKYKSTHMGKVYYFCSATCKAKFDKSPMKYV